MKSIYLDNNSTTLIDSDVAKTISECMAMGFVNPASQHQQGQLARRKLETIRSEILAILGAAYQGMESDQLVFTSGGSESNNLALSGLAYEPDGQLPEIRRILISSIEHPSIKAAADFLVTRGFEVESIRCDENSIVQLDHLETLLNTPTRLVSVMSVNHETGSIQPIRQIAEMCHLQGAKIHTDAVQAVGKIPVSFDDWGVDAMSFTAHKLHGPKGSGGLMLKNSIQLFPLIFGGFQQLSFRPGTEDVCLPAGLLMAIKKFVDSIESRTRHVERLRERMESKLLENCDVTINGSKVKRVPHTSNLSFLGVNRQEFLIAADLNGLAVSTGSACASGSSDPSPVLQAMGLDDDIVDSAIRISLSAFTTALEIDLACDRIINISNNLRR